MHQWLKSRHCNRARRFTVERRYTLRDLRDLLKLLREELAPWDAMLCGQTNKGRATAVYAVRGSLNDSPLAIERTDF